MSIAKELAEWIRQQVPTAVGGYAGVASGIADELAHRIERGKADHILGESDPTFDEMTFDDLSPAVEAAGGHLTYFAKRKSGKTTTYEMSAVVTRLLDSTRRNATPHTIKASDSNLYVALARLLMGLVHASSESGTGKPTPIQNGKRQHLIDLLTSSALDVRVVVMVDDGSSPVTIGIDEDLKASDLYYFAGVLAKYASDKL